MSRAAPSTTSSERRMAASEVSTCAHSTLDRAIGIERKRSRIPPAMSVKIRKAV